MVEKERDQVTDAELDAPGPVSVGIALTTDPNMTRGLLEQFCLALSDATGIEVIPHGVSSYRSLLDQLATAEVDIVWLPPIPALRATANNCVSPIALPIRSGDTFYYAALFARSDSPIREPGDLQGLKAAWVDPQSAAGYLIVRAYLELQAVDLKTAFAKNLFFGSHDAVTEAVVKGAADVGATYVYYDEEQRPKRAGWGEADVHVVAKAGPIPNDFIAARKGLSGRLVRLVQDALVDVNNAPLREAARLLLTADGFAVPTPEHIEPLQALLTGLQEASDHPHSMFPPPA